MGLFQSRPTPVQTNFHSIQTPVQTDSDYTPSPEPQKPWRPIDWSEHDAMLDEVKEFEPSIETLKIMLYGPTGSGKSSFINSVQRVFLGRNAMSALENSTFTGNSFTKKMKIHKLKKSRGEHYPLEIIDIMGLQSELGGILPEDIISVFKGHVLDGYIFNTSVPISDQQAEYKKDPVLSDQVHCLVVILDADSVSRMDKTVFDKIQKVRASASLLDIPQVIILTKVDKACELVKEDLLKIFDSKKIKEKVHLCHVNVGVSLNAIYPVKNYSEDTTPDADIDVLILTALRNIQHFANDYVEHMLEKEAKHSNED